MTAITGFPLIGVEPDAPYPMDEGNLDDETFVSYLKSLARHKFI